jgi:hypothetical protein
MRYASLIVAGALVGEVVLATYAPRLCSELPPTSVRACQWEISRPEGVHTLSATAAGEGMMLRSPGMYAVASGVSTPTRFTLSTFLMNHGLTITGVQGVDGVIEWPLE